MTDKPMLILIAGPYRSGTDGDPQATAANLYPAADRLLAHCDAVLRLPGDSAGADQDVAVARRRGLPVYHDVTEIPRRAPQETA